MNEKDTIATQAKIIKNLIKITAKQQIQINKVAQDLANSNRPEDLNPGQMQVEINETDVGTDIDTAPPPAALQVNDTIQDDRTAILAAMSPELRDAVAGVAIVGDMVHIKFKPNRGTDEEFNSLEGVIARAVPGRNMRYTDAPIS